MRRDIMVERYGVYRAGNDEANNRLCEVESSSSQVTRITILSIEVMEFKSFANTTRKTKHICLPSQ